MVGPGAGSGVPSPPKAKRQAHAGAHRPLHPHPTREQKVFAAACACCGADVSGVRQVVCDSYDRIDIPPILPDVTHYEMGVAPQMVAAALPFLNGQGRARSWDEQVGAK